eukprot:TRINITY_DN23868_c0_g1_i1.p1 TRINITY_DN23868_c0_g1~~TRINITY_DN23868_c0_g1_i1.p1  ORF type:complete len:1400 (+),score=215.37 TRINITY_DN23868_c0_g1_i1:240-4439(+)
MAALDAVLSARTGNLSVLHETREELGDSDVLAYAARVVSPGTSHECATVIVVATCCRQLRLHWATADHAHGPWQPAPHGWTTRPARSFDGGGGAWVTDFESVGHDCQVVDVTVPRGRHFLAFVLRTDHDRFVKKGGVDMYLPLLTSDEHPFSSCMKITARPYPADRAPVPEPPAAEALSVAAAASIPQTETSQRVLGTLNDALAARSAGAFVLHSEQGELRDTAISAYAVQVVSGSDSGQSCRVILAVAAGGEPCLYWGLLNHKGGAWNAPSKGWQTTSSRDSNSMGHAALLSNFEESDDNIKLLELSFSDVQHKFMAFVFRRSDGEFVKCRGGGDCAVPLRSGGSNSRAGLDSHNMPNDQRHRLCEGTTRATEEELCLENFRTTGSHKKLNLHKHLCEGVAVKNREDMRPESSRASGDPRKKLNDLKQVGEEVSAATEEDSSLEDTLPLSRIVRKERSLDDMRCATGISPGDGNFDAQLADDIAHREEGCQRSLMHRYNCAAEIMGRVAQRGQDGLVVLFAWFRYMSMRQLVINRNYNVKPREISAAQEKVTIQLAEIYRSRPESREITRMTMMTIGRGGAGDIGQRIRDEILEVQKRNDCKGGMMEEWHQKLHNNTCPDDVVICEALIEYIEAGLDISIYWAHLAKYRISKSRLASYDRKICSEPCFRQQQCGGLLRDLREYLKTLKAVHSGDDLNSAASAVLGYTKDSRKGVAVRMHPIAAVATPCLHDLLHLAMKGAEATRQGGDPLLALEPMVEARWELRPWTVTGADELGSRLKDVLYLDLALEASIRTIVEGCLARICSYAPSDAMELVSIALENVAMSSGCNSELLMCLKEWHQVRRSAVEGVGDWALHAKSVMDRIHRELASRSDSWMRALQPPSSYLGDHLHIPASVVQVFAEEVVRGGAAAPLAQLLRALDPILRKVANLGSWQIISPVTACGRIICVDDLTCVQFVTYDEPTVLVARSVGGDEEIPEGVVGLMTMDTVDVLSHVAVRARNERCFFATLFDKVVFDEIAALDGSLVMLKPLASGDAASFERVDKAPQDSASEPNPVAHSRVGIVLRHIEFGGTFAVVSSSFSDSVAGGKSCNLNGLRGQLPDWIKLPASVAIPFGSFDSVVADAENTRLREQLQAHLALLRTKSDTVDKTLDAIRSSVQQLRPPVAFVTELRVAFEAEGLPWPGDGHEDKLHAAAWAAITGVWASKWNDRAYISCRKAGIDHAAISMAVLCQEVVQARYAFVIHTTNPSTGDAGEIYAEVVCGLGETLVGNYTGRALSFVASKHDTSRLALKSFPNKNIGVFVNEPTMIFRSDSNAEDLEGYAGAGLYDSIIMGGSIQKAIDYSAEPLLRDAEFRTMLLHKIAEAGRCIERVLGSAQDIEGAVDAAGNIFILQTRPQV